MDRALKIVISIKRKTGKCHTVGEDFLFFPRQVIVFLINEAKESIHIDIWSEEAEK